MSKSWQGSINWFPEVKMELDFDTYNMEPDIKKRID